MPVSSSKVKEYLYKLTPLIDTQKWEKATSFLDDKLNKKQKEYNKALEHEAFLQKQLITLEEKRKNLIMTKADLLTKQKYLGGEGENPELDALIEDYTKQIETTTNTMGNVQAGLNALSAETSSAGDAMTKTTKVFENSGVAITNLVGLFSNSMKKAIEILDKGSEIGNKFVSSQSMFVDEDVKSKMAKYGVGSTTAQSIIAVQEQLGIDESDYATMTEGQKRLFDDLMQYYQEGLDSIDAEKLEKFNDATQKYQAMVAKFNLSLDMAITKIFAESEALPELLDTLGMFMDTVVDLLSSDAAQFAFDTFINFISTILKILSAPMKLFGGGGNNTTTNTTNNTTNNYYGVTDNKLNNPLYLQMARG